MKTRYALQLCGSMLALVGATATMAQSGASAPGPGAAQTAPAGAVQDGTSPASTDAASDGGLQEIVVTAQRRAQTQQSVPIAVSTVTADMAQKSGVTGTEALNISVPGLQFSRSTANGGTPFLRGVGSTLATPGFEPAVATYVDDVYIGASTGNLMSFNNIDQIEVLKGPQGTLFGRNATGGVVNIRTRRPSHTTSLDLRAGYGNYDTASGSLYATTGISDTLAMNFAASGNHQDNGYGRNVNTGQDIYKSKDYGFRSQLLWEPSADTSVLVSGDYSRLWTDTGMNTTIFPGTKSTDGSTYHGRYTSTHSPIDFDRVKQYGASARVDQDFTAFRVASISAYRKSSAVFGIDNDGGPANLFRGDVFPSTRTLSQELQVLAPKASDIQWIGGLFYFDSKAKDDPFRTSGSLSNGGAGVTTIAKQHLKSYAGFGDASATILPETKLTLGVRYSSDHLRLNALRANNAGVVLAPGPLAASSKFSKLTYRAVLDHHFTKDVMVYGSYSRGFKSGAYNVTGPTIVIGGVTQVAAPVAPEVLDAFEIGLKSEFLDHHLRLNVAAFHYNYKNLQVTVLQNGVPQSLNAAAAKVDGVDVDIVTIPVRNLTLSLSGEYLHSRFTNFPNGPTIIQNPANCTTLTTTGPVTGGGTTCFTDLSGRPTARAPKFTGSFTANYAIPSEIGDFNLSGTYYHNSGYGWDPDHQLLQPQYNLLNGAISWTSSDKRFEITAWAKNLTKAYYFSYVSASTFKFSGSPEAPRTYGFTLGLHVR